MQSTAAGAYTDGISAPEALRDAIALRKALIGLHAGPPVPLVAQGPALIIEGGAGVEIGHHEGLPRPRRNDARPR